MKEKTYTKCSCGRLFETNTTNNGYCNICLMNKEKLRIVNIDCLCKECKEKVK